MVNQNTLRSKGFRLVKLGGPITMLSNDKPFTVNGKAARFKNHEYVFNMRGWWDGPIPRDIEVTND